ncbi:helix-turn-helix domain-containing protein [Actinophytocola glycyrrhizae]|uniref:Helix-turn-helix domain-containing protein n=1 Tax=Actinophytocola glycyrrhizae TaxID=2044873 RepID=A0ABV9S741_9PSEU
MPGKVKYLGGVGDRGLGMELRHYREKAGMSCARVGEVLGWSANTISRLERGLRPETTAEEVSAILAAVGVTGPDRDRIMRMAKGYREQGWWEGNKTHLTDQARTYLKFEARATRIIDVEPLLVPGLLQTADYCRALMAAFGVEVREIEGRVARRLGRQAIVTRPDPPELVFVVSELMLRQPVGGAGVMARQVHRIVEDAERPHVAVRVVPAAVAAHPGLHGAFTMLQFADEPAVVFVEGRMSGMFPENPDEIAAYTLSAERLIDLTLGQQESLQLLHAIAEDLERAR